MINPPEALRLHLSVPENGSCLHLLLQAVSAGKLVCSVSFETSLDLRQYRVLLTCSEQYLNTLPMCTATLIFILAAACYHLMFMLHVLRSGDEVTLILLLRMILKLLICFSEIIVKRFPLPKCTRECFLVWLNSFYVSQTFLFLGISGRLLSSRDELFIHSLILGHSFP